MLSALAKKGLRGVSVSGCSARASRSVSRSVAPAAASDSFLSGTSGNYIDEMYANWKADPRSVHASWDAYFKTGSYQAPPTLVADYAAGAQRTSSPTGAVATGIVSGDAKLVQDTIKVVQMIRAFQVRGHLIADLDPLGIIKARGPTNEFELSHWGFTEADLDREFDVSQADVQGLMGADRGKMTLRNIYRRLQQTYCNKIGVEYMHIPDRESCNWLRSKFETPEEQTCDKTEKLQILDRLTWSDHFERFCAQKYNTAKRFGLEGCESLIPGLRAMIDSGADSGVANVVIGMPHRGRLVVLNAVVNKPLEQIFHEFSGVGQTQETEGSGDVKYHLGYSSNQIAGTKGNKVHVSLVANPSHLEAVNTVVCGKARAKQFYESDKERSGTVPILLHGDAAFAGQGIVFETMGLSDLPSYTSGGCVHIIVNNQIGFTTNPTDVRQSPYCSDLAKAFNAPILHVNAEDPEAVVRVCKIAMEWRQRFKKDVVIDLIGYRKHGHNEIDEPDFTQPNMYAIIRKKKSLLDVYVERLLGEGSVSAAEATGISTKIKSHMEEKFQASKTYKYGNYDWLGSKWAGLTGSRTHSKIRATGVSKEKLQDLGARLTHMPSDFTFHRVVKTVYENRAKSIKNNAGIDWATGEMLAFATLLDEGTHVRLSGQDVERGTFSHRHALVHDQKDQHRTHTPLAQVSRQTNLFSVSNSNLSEFGVLGFEYGYSLENPYSLVLWEGQFGDFVNGAQIMLDQFIASAEAKWLRQSGLTLLLPHGYEGAGPEHSSCRIERFLQNSDDHPDVVPDMHPDRTVQIQSTNWQVANVTTPANYFHILRRQVARNFRKPLVIATPKSLLRHKSAVSTLDDIAEGTQFQRVIPDVGATAAASKVRRVVFCTGKVYYDLAAARDANPKQFGDVAIARVEQISPFPFDLVAEEQKRFPNAEIVWAQEEPMNMGAWTYVQPRIETALKATTQRRARYVGRLPAASPATGWGSTHTAEQNALVAEALA